jgi:hypothetical protein
MPDQQPPDIDPDEVRDEMHSAVERIREQFRRRHPDMTEPEPEPDLPRESETQQNQLEFLNFHSEPLPSFRSASNSPLMVMRLT